MKRALLVFLTLATFLFSVPQPAVAYYDWYEYPTYTADDYITRGDGPEEYIYWLHTVAVIQYHYREDHFGRIRLISCLWYSIEHSCKTTRVGGDFWNSCLGVVGIYVIRGGTEIFTVSGPWESYVFVNPGIAFRSGDRLVDSSSSGVYGVLWNDITIM